MASIDLPGECYWVECQVRLPKENRDEATGAFTEFRCTAKVGCADVVDALDLDRWATQAFQHLWKSAGRSHDARVKELARAKWCIERSMNRGGRNWQTQACDVVANLLEAAASPEQVAELAAGLRQRDKDAVARLAVAYIEEIRPDG